MTLPVSVFGDTTQSKVAMQGQAIVLGGRQTSQILLNLESNGSQRWLLNIVLNTPVVKREKEDRENEEDREYEHKRTRLEKTTVSGSFTLGTPQQPVSRGTVTGSLNNNNTGDIDLSDGNSSVSLEMSFAVTSGGTVTATVTGQWPLIPAPHTSAPNEVPAVPGPVTSPAVTPDTPQQTNQFYWYLSRTSALLAYILLFINVCLGIGLKSKCLDWLWARWRTFDLHQFTTLLGGALVMLHIFSLLGDSYLKFSLSDLLVPMASPYRPLWTALGTIGFYAGLVIALSFYIRRLIGQQTWRFLHYLSFIMFFMVLFHGIKAGTDSSMIWVQSLYISTGTVVTFLTLWRFLIYRVTNHVPQIIPTP